MGWIDIVGRQQQDLAMFRSLATEVKDTKFENVLLLGMGGSSLCPEVLSITFGSQPGFPALHIVDSTDPAQIKAVRDRVDLKRTLIIVASKSGSTLEPNIFKQYFFEEMNQAIGTAEAGSHFLAITDPGSKPPAPAPAWALISGTISARCTPATTSPSWLFWPCSPSMRRRFRPFAIACATPGAWPPAWVLGRASCTPPGRTIKEVRIRASFCRLPAITPSTSRFRGKNTALAW